MTTKRTMRQELASLKDQVEFLQAQVGQLQHRMAEAETGHRQEILAGPTVTEGKTVIYQFPQGNTEEAAAFPWKPSR